MYAYRHTEMTRHVVCGAGVDNGTFVFVLPGSLDAVTTAWKRLIQAQLDSNTRPCNLAQLRSRLRE